MKTPQTIYTWSEREEKEQEEAVAMVMLISDMLRWRFVLPAAHTTEREKESYTNTNRTMWLIFDVCLADSRQTYRLNALRGWGGDGPPMEQRDSLHPFV